VNASHSTALDGEIRDCLKGLERLVRLAGDDVSIAPKHKNHVLISLIENRRPYSQDYTVSRSDCLIK
jgi:hypothetical protein